MRLKNSTILQATVAMTILFTALFSPCIMAQKKSSATKIGTYDSRVVTFAWSRSDFFKQQMIKMTQKSDSAEKAHDTARVRELSVKSMSYQHLLHQMVFSNGSMGVLMALVKDKLPGLAKTARVSLILSKWELNYLDPSVETVDLTNQVAQLFQPKDDIAKMAGEISVQPPIPLDELGIESDMLDSYCQRFGNK